MRWRAKQEIYCKGMILPVILILSSTMMCLIVYLYMQVIVWVRATNTMRNSFLDYQKLIIEEQPPQRELLACYNCRTLGGCFIETMVNREQKLYVIWYIPLFACPQKSQRKKQVSWYHEF